MERLLRLLFFPLDARPRFALAFLRPAGFATRRALFARRFERGEMAFFADVFLRLLPLFFIAAFRDEVGFRAAAFFVGRFPSDEDDVTLRAELVVDRLAAVEVEIGVVEISLAVLGGVTAL